ncbi:energy-coupling factor ABC transporter ATP-binding protein [Comamonas sp. J-3]|uniref:energy-coupling factor ABC transporter ATP-binding protein n=1 Tax=Comamonas trifloxystrobinivorans TaxID=3350256 RepID=UPI003727D2EB
MSAPSATPASGIQLQDVHLIRGAQPVFAGLSLSLTERRIGLIGDNGAGKTSLFRLLCGLEVAQQGQVLVAGHDVQRQREQLPGVVGLMFQNPDDQIIFPTVEEELGLSLQYQGVARKAAIVQAQAFLAQRGLAAWAPRAVSSLSQGQRQQVCFLAMLLAAPQVMLLDEPFASLDLPGQARLAAELERSPAQTVISTHVLAHVRHFERVVWLDQGRVRADGPGDTVCAAYEADVAARSQALSANANTNPAAQG